MSANIKLYSLIDNYYSECNFNVLKFIEMKKPITINQAKKHLNSIVKRIKTNKIQL
jgi:hypothetical protein